MILAYSRLFSTETDEEDALREILDSDDIRKFESDGYIYDSYEVATYGIQHGVDLHKRNLWMLKVRLVRQDG